MSLEGTRRVMETTSHDTANQYLRFGWSLINQYVVEATQDRPAAVVYVLASVRRLEDTRQVETLSSSDEVNEYLKLGWKLVDRFVTTDEMSPGRQEKINFLVAWQNDEPPQRPGEPVRVDPPFSIAPPECDDDL